MHNFSTKKNQHLCAGSPCGIGTVSRVINNQTGVSDAAREKILRVIEENGFEPNVITSQVCDGVQQTSLNVRESIIPAFKCCCGLSKG